MLSSKVDLTEHRDFGHSNGQGDGYDIPIEYYWDDDCMTPEQYAAILRWEKIFGKRQRTEKYKIFEHITTQSPYETESRCRKCGKSLRLPWNKVAYTLKKSVFCHECYKKNNESDMDNRIPWRNKSRIGSSDSTFYNLFNLR